VDELWERYRTFWTPVLIGVCVLLVGVIVVHIINDDPDEVAAEVRRQESQIRLLKQPPDATIRAVRENAETLGEQTSVWAKRLDQVRLAPDPLEAAAAQALEAAILRGGQPDAFDEDGGSLPQARARLERTLADRVELLRGGDPNVGFSRLLNDVWMELRVRANRADVDLNADQLGFTTVTSVTRASLPQRLLNLALVARIVDVAVRSGVRSVDDVRFEQHAAPPGDDFLREWPLTIVLTGTMDALRPVLRMLSDPEHPTPLLGVEMRPPRRRAAGGEGIVELEIKTSSVQVRPEAPMDLLAEEE
jgi:hypothetical protein